MRSPHTVTRLAWRFAVVGSLVGAGFVSGSSATAAPHRAVHVRHGHTVGSTVFPNNRFTVRDHRQVTGRRVALPVPHCSAATRSRCDALRLLNQLDGFDLQPRVTVPFSGAINVKTVTPKTVWVQGPKGKRAGLFQIVLNPRTHVLEGTVDKQLAEDTHYTIVITRGVHDTHGQQIAKQVRVGFSTETATRELDRLRRALDNHHAYNQAHITKSQRGLSFRQGSLRTVFTGSTVAKEGITRNDQTSADPSKKLTSSTVPDLVDPGSIGEYAFGSFRSPQFLTHDAVIPQVPTKRTPRARSAARLGFAMIVPVGSPPAGGWPVAVYGPGFTRSYFDLFVTADHNASLGIATVATDPVGHGYGRQSTITVTHAPTPGAASTTTTFRSFGRGRERDGDGTITADEGVQPSDHKTLKHGKLKADRPARDGLVGLRDGLIQTTVDNMALVRTIERGVHVPTDTGSIQLSRKNVEYYGLSFGAIYGTMLLGTDPHVRVGFLNSGGGPILDIARLSGFRDLLAAQLKISRPKLLNGGPGLNGFTESWPEPTDPPITHPYRKSGPIRRFLSYGNWLERQGSPETFAPLIRLHPRHGAKVVEYLNAYGDHTVPNITTGNILRAGHLFDRFTYYRNDKTPTNGTDPHGFLADPTLAGRSMAEEQLGTFLQSHGKTVVDPDGAGPVFENPISERNNLQCLHYAEPQTGKSAYPPAPSGNCPPVRH